MISLFKTSTIILVLTLFNGCGGDSSSSTPSSPDTRPSSTTDATRSATATSSPTRSSTASSTPSSGTMDNMPVPQPYEVPPIPNCKKDGATLVVAEGEMCIDGENLLECNKGVVTLNGTEKSNDTIVKDGKTYSCQ